MDAESSWWVIVPMKDTQQAKSRLGGRPGDRRQVAIVMARDTLCAIVNAARVAGVLVVCQEDEDIESFSLPGITVAVRERLGINEAICAGVETLASDGVTADVAALPGDLPYLRSAELDVALARAALVDTACVGDRADNGTTLLTARSAAALRPAYGPESLRAHRAMGAVELGIPAWSGLRRDVDVPGDLVPGPGLGYRTRMLLEKRAAAPQPVLEGSGSP